MPTDLQASTSSTSSSSICKQSSLDDSYGLERSRDESSLSKDLMLTHISNGTLSPHCCTPVGIKCVYEEEVIDHSPNDRCKLVCTNPNCDQSGWIHSACLKVWEHKIKNDVGKLNPQLRHVVERQRSFNPWIDILSTALANDYLCPCNRGSLKLIENGNNSSGVASADNQYFSGQNSSIRRKVGPNSQIQTTQANSNYSSSNGNRKHSLEINSSASFNSFNKRMRSRTLSANQMIINFTPDGLIMNPYDFSPLKKDFVKQPVQNKPINGLIPIKGKSQSRQRHHSATYNGSNITTKEESTVPQPVPNSAGNIFKQRGDFQSLKKLPFSKQNAYFVQMEDDSCTGNDDTKVFLLTHLSQRRMNFVKCLICSAQLPVYDHLPLIDGTFFLSPVCHSANRSIPIPSSSCPPGSLNSSSANGMSSYQQSEKYLHAICIHCMHEIVICCQFCHRPWTGAQLLVGSLYTYDIFAAVPCCTTRLMCNKCNRLCVEISVNAGSTGTGNGNNGATGATSESTTPKSNGLSLSTLLSNFSQLSRSVECVSCHNRDYHFVKPFPEIYKPITSSS